MLRGALGAGWGARKVLGCFGRSSEGARQAERPVWLLHPDPLGAGPRIPVLAWARVGGGASLRKRPSWEPRLWASGFVTISGELGHPQCCCTSPSSDLATQCPGAAQGCPQRGRRPGDALTQPCTVTGLCTRRRAAHLRDGETEAVGCLAGHRVRGAKPGRGEQGAVGRPCARGH